MIFKNNDPKTTLSIQYFLHFSVMGVFLPYFNLYCYHLNYTEFQIGLLSAVRALSMVFFSVIWGLIADRLITRKASYIICTITSTFIWSALTFTVDYNFVLPTIFIYSIFYGPIIAFLETYALDILNSSGENKSGYGNIRVWGSISFILMSVIIGSVLQQVSINIIIIIILLTSAGQAFHSFKLPTSRLLKYNFNISTFKNFFSLKTCFFLLATFLMLLSHGTYYGFFSIHLEKNGFSAAFIGVAWGLASLSEIIVMLKSETIFKRFSINSTLIFSFIITCIRWVILYFTKNLYLILLSQILHAITYGTFHIACILYIDKLTSKETKTFGQIVNNATSYGLGMMCGFIINGLFFKQYGEKLFIFSSITALTGCTVLLISFRIKANR